MGAENITQRGIDIECPDGKKRNFKLGMVANAYLAEKHGSIKKVYSKLSGEIDDAGNQLEKVDGDMSECQLDAMIDIVYAGLKRDFERNKEAFTRTDALNLIDDLGVDVFFNVISGGIKESLPDPQKGQEMKE